MKQAYSVKYTSIIKILVAWYILAVLHITAYAQNYDESKVPVYTLPDVLKTSGGRVVADKASWESTRRPEVLQLFEDNVYGQMPKDYDSIQFNVINDVPDAMDGKARLQEVKITVWRSGRLVQIQLVVFIPVNARLPVPAFLLINNRSPTNTDATRTVKSEFWPAEMLIAGGYAIAAFHVSDAAPDNKETYRQGVLQLYPSTPDTGNGMKAIGAWAWGASRVMDYFEHHEVIDARRTGVVGHSRGGKAALWAGAQDRRFAMVIANCSGNTGAALARRRFGETISMINGQFPYWFCNNYKKYNDNEAALPVDQHMLISLIAPRPVYVTSASKDLWADPKGSYLSLIHAQKVYALYGVVAPLAPEPPPLNSPVIQSVMGYHNREGIHDLTSFDWSNFIRFADHHYHKK